METEFRGGVRVRRSKIGLEKLAIVFEGQKLDFIVCYVRLFIVFTRLARAAQPNDIILIPGPCFVTPMLLFESEFRLPPWPLES